MTPDNITLHPTAFASKSLTSTKWRCSNIKHEVLGILHGLEKFHHYCFGKEVLIITDHKPLVVMFKKDVATMLQHIQCILLKFHQYRVQIIYKPGPEIFTADRLLSNNQVEGKDKPIKDMGIHVDTIQNSTDMLECVSMAEIQQASSQDNHLQQLKKFIIAGWPNTKDELHANIRLYWPCRDKLVVIDGIILKGRCIVIPNSLWQQVLAQLHTSHMGIEKTELLMQVSHSIGLIVASWFSLEQNCSCNKLIFFWTELKFN